jgi:hypothetical protein
VIIIIIIIIIINNNNNNINNNINIIITLRIFAFVNVCAALNPLNASMSLLCTTSGDDAAVAAADVNTAEGDDEKKFCWRFKYTIAFSRFIFASFANDLHRITISSMNIVRVARDALSSANLSRPFNLLSRAQAAAARHRPSISSNMDANDLSRIVRHLQSVTSGGSSSGSSGSSSSSSSSSGSSGSSGSGSGGGSGGGSSGGAAGGEGSGVAIIGSGTHSNTSLFFVRFPAII